jgi:hypothetical protein
MKQVEDEPSGEAAELEDFERSVSSSRRAVGLAMALIGTLGGGASAFLRIQAGLGHEQWAPTATGLFWAGVVAMALLFGHSRGRSGPAAIDSMSEGSRLRVGTGVVIALLVAMGSAAVDCGAAHLQSHAVHKVYPTITQMRFDADGGLLLFGIVVLAGVRSRSG